MPVKPPASPRVRPVYLPLAALALSLLLTAWVSAAELRELRSRRYVVRTDLDADVAAPYVEHMDKLYDEFARRFDAFRPRHTPRCDLLLFNKRADYTGHLGKLGFSGANTGGVFFMDGRSSAVATYLEGRPRSQTLGVLQHEGFHQFAALYFVNTLPIWINEGLAEYFQDALLVDGKFVLGIPESRRVRALQRAIPKGEAVPFNAVLSVSPQQWSNAVASDPERAMLLYAQSWSMVHFLIHGDNRRYEPLLVRYLKLLNDGQRSADAFRQVFGDASGFEAKWRRHVLGLSPDALAVAAERLAFLGDAIADLASEGRGPLPTDWPTLKAALERRGYTSRRVFSGVMTTHSVRDETAFTYPGADGKELPFDPVPAVRGMPPGLTAPTLKPRPTLYWIKLKGGDLSPDVRYK